MLRRTLLGPSQYSLFLSPQGLVYIIVCKLKFDPFSSHITISIKQGMQLSLEARQRIHERYERQSVSQRQLAEDFQVSLSTVKRILKRSKDDLGRRAGSGLILARFMSANASASPNMPNNTPDAFLREYADEIERKCRVRVTEQAVSVHLRKL